MEKITSAIASAATGCRGLFSRPHPTFPKLTVGVSAFLATTFLITAYSELLWLDVFGHDEVHYYSDFSFKLVEDGRWLNFLLHNFLRTIPPETWIILFAVSSWALFFSMARSLGFDDAYAVLLAATILISPPFIQQSLWPATIFPAVIVLLLAKFLVDRCLPCPAVYLISGVLLFGTMQSFYFLVPLLFLGQFISVTKNSAVSWILLFKNLTWWVIGAVAGLFIMSITVWMLTGHFGVQPAEWRQTQPIRNTEEFVRNLLYVINAMHSHLLQLIRMAGTDNGVFFTFVFFVFIVRLKAILRSPGTLIILAAVAAAFFAISIPLAPVIETRSLVALSAAFVIFFSILPGRSTAGQVTGSLLLLYISYFFFISGYAYLSRHKEETTFFYDKLKQVISGYPKSYSSLALFGVMTDGSPEAAIFNSPSRMHGIIHALDVDQYLDCRQGSDRRCDNISVRGLQSVQSIAQGYLYFFVNKDNVAIIQYKSAANLIDE
jgi:hypothetical protein